MRVELVDEVQVHTDARYVFAIVEGVALATRTIVRVNIHLAQILQEVVLLYLRRGDEGLVNRHAPGPDARIQATFFSNGHIGWRHGLFNFQRLARRQIVQFALHEQRTHNTSRKGISRTSFDRCRSYG